MEEGPTAERSLVSTTGRARETEQAQRAVLGHTCEGESVKQLWGGPSPALPILAWPCERHVPAGPAPLHTKTLARASAPALAIRALLGWKATSWMASSCFLRWAVISCMQVLLSRFHSRREQSWPAGDTGGTWQAQRGNPGLLWGAAGGTSTGQRLY